MGNEVFESIERIQEVFMRSKLVFLVFLSLLVCLSFAPPGQPGSGKDGTDRQSYNRLVSRFD